MKQSIATANKENMDDRMQVVMASAWDFAPPSLAVMDEGSDDEEGQQPVTGGCASTPILGGWPALRMPQR
jgi:hypothetical protein